MLSLIEQTRMTFQVFRSRFSEGIGVVERSATSPMPSLQLAVVHPVLPDIRSIERINTMLKSFDTINNDASTIVTSAINPHGEVVNSRVTVKKAVAPKKPATPKPAPKRTPVAISRINASEIFRVGICGDPGKRRVEITLRNGNRFMHKHTYAINASLKITDNDCVDSAMRMATLVRKAPSVTIAHWSLLPQSK